MKHRDTADANPYEPPATVSPANKTPLGAFAAKLCVLISWAMVLLVAVGLGALYSQGRIGLVADPQYAGLFGLALLAGAPAALFRLNRAVRMAAVVFGVASFSLWLIYAAPLLRNPRRDELTGLALGAAMLCFSMAIVVFALLAAITSRAKIKT